MQTYLSFAGLSMRESNILLFCVPTGLLKLSPQIKQNPMSNRTVDIITFLLHIGYISIKKLNIVQEVWKYWTLSFLPQCSSRLSGHQFHLVSAQMPCLNFFHTVGTSCCNASVSLLQSSSNTQFCHLTLMPWRRPATRPQLSCCVSMLIFVLSKYEKPNTKQPATAANCATGSVEATHSCLKCAGDSGVVSLQKPAAVANVSLSSPKRVYNCLQGNCLH